MNNPPGETLPGSTDIMVELIKVSKRYPPDVVALDTISLTIPRGEMLFVIGMSGAGKTTLLKLMATMEAPSNGLIEIGGEPIQDLRGAKLARLRQRIGVAYQDFKLLLNRTAAENIAISMEVSYKKPQYITKRVRTLLDQLNLADKHGMIAGELSRGEQQRVTLARAVANSPALILVDEPTGNLDAITTEWVMKLLANSHKAGATIVIATHDDSLYRDSGCRVIELHKGNLLGISGERP
ncbi:MAG: cell division ATP-binding protein FtsE [Desulfobulbaceae bacterium]|jgi:cell division transport system ATP-binding protein|nr:cell division ATP-binding protein FtsE [Desulfobulbaceae bacterium]